MARALRDDLDATVLTELGKMKIPLLTGAILVAIAIGALARTGGVSDGHAQQQFLAGIRRDDRIHLIIQDPQPPLEVLEVQNPRYIQKTGSSFDSRGYFV